MANPESPGGLIPSRGLNVSHVTQILSKAGSYPDIYWKDSDDLVATKRFYRALYAYVESGIPVFAAMSAKQHAITILGHGVVGKEPSPGSDKICYSWDLINSIVVADDNHLPYKTITENGPPYSIRDIDAFIVPLPEKIYYSAEDVMAFTEDLINSGMLGRLDLSFISEPIVRCFLTTSSGYKKFIRRNESRQPVDLCQAIMELPMPQFIWVVEISTPGDWRQRECCARFILDATASKYEVRPYFVVHDQNGAYIHERASTRDLSYLDFKGKILSQPLYENNLLQVP
jgi:hypothetical protein